MPLFIRTSRLDQRLAVLTPRGTDVGSGEAA